MAIPGISVIIRARDEAANLARCLDVLSAQQGAGDVETILVDGGSRDRTPQVAAERGAAVIALAAHESASAARSTPERRRRTIR